MKPAKEVADESGRKVNLPPINPLFPADQLRAYADVDPSFPDRLLKQWELQTQHRVGLERRRMDLAFWGLITGFLVCTTFLAASWDLIRTGHEVAGTVLGSVDLVSLVGLFVYAAANLHSGRSAK